MLEELFNLVKGTAEESVINNPDVPNEQNNEVVAVLDVDSELLNHFDETDKKYLEEIVEMIVF